MMERIAGVVCALSLLVVPCGAANFHGVGVGNMGGSAGERPLISGDGSTVVVNVAVDDDVVPACWTVADGLMLPQDLPRTGVDHRWATGISNDGSVLVGRVTLSETVDTGLYRWDSSGGATNLGSLEGLDFSPRAADVSADGSVVVGRSGNQAFRWTAETGMVSLGLTASRDGSGTEAVACSADGNVIAGTSISEYYNFYWTSAEGGTWLSLVGANFVDVSGDGRRILLAGKEYASWLGPDGTYEYLGDSYTLSKTYAMSSDGSTIVGHRIWWESLPEGGGDNRHEACVWDEVNGTRLLIDELASLGVDLDGWVLREATDISDDGRTIVGTGINPQGQEDVWVATVPEPATMVLLSAGAMALLRRRSAQVLRRRKNSPRITPIARNYKKAPAFI